MCARAEVVHGVGDVPYFVYVVPSGRRLEDFGSTYMRVDCVIIHGDIRLRCTGEPSQLLGEDLERSRVEF